MERRSGSSSESKAEGARMRADAGELSGVYMEWEDTGRLLDGLQV